MDHSTVGANHSALGEHVVDRVRLQMSHHLVGVVRPGRLDRGEIGHRRRVVRSVPAVRHLLDLLEVPLRPRSRLVVGVPVPRIRQKDALRCLEPERIHVAEIHQKCCHLHVRRDAELVRGLDRVDQIAAGICQAEDLGLGRLSLQEVGGEVLGRDRMLGRAENRASTGLYDP